LWSSSELSLAAWDREETAWVKLGAAMDWGMLPVLWLALYVLLVTLTGVQSYFFHPRSIPVVRQNRAVALSYYGCGAVAWLPVSLASMVMCIVVSNVDFSRKIPLVVMVLVWIVGVSVFVIPPFCGWLNVIRLLGRSTQCGKVRQWVMGALLPVLWVLLIGIVGLGIPLAYAFVCLVVLSLR
jgi:hypothetical protein